MIKTLPFLLSGLALAAPGAQAAPLRTMDLAYAKIECVVLPDRRVRDCRVVEESRQGAGATLIRMSEAPGYRISEAMASTVRDGKVLIELPLPFIPPASR